MRLKAPSRTEPATNRLEGLDPARYLAFIGMAFVNFNAAMTAAMILDCPSEFGADGGMVSTLIAALQGRAAATFMVLAGTGLRLAGRRADF